MPRSIRRTRSVVVRATPPARGRRRLSRQVRWPQLPGARHAGQHRGRGAHERAPDARRADIPAVMRHRLRRGPERGETRCARSRSAQDRASSAAARPAISRSSNRAARSMVARSADSSTVARASNRCADTSRSAARRANARVTWAGTGMGASMERVASLEVSRASSVSASGFPAVARYSRSAVSGGTPPSSPLAAARSSPPTWSVGRSASSSNDTSSSRTASTAPSGSASMRRNAKRMASADEASSRWASSMSRSVGASSA